MNCESYFPENIFPIRQIKAIPAPSKTSNNFVRYLIEKMTLGVKPFGKYEKFWELKIVPKFSSFSRTAVRKCFIKETH